MSETAIQLEILKRDMEVLAGVADKFNRSIDKMDGIINTFDKLIALHDHRLSQAEAQNKLLHERISDLKSETLKEIKELRRENSEQHSSAAVDRKAANERISSLEKWRWMMVGGAAALGFAFSFFNNFNFDKFFT